jgi:hypothetical protein
MVSDFELKLLDIESEHLGIPDTEYKAIVKMPAGLFQRIIRNLSALGDTGKKKYFPAIIQMDLQRSLTVNLSRYCRKQGQRQVLRLRRRQG